MSVEKCKNKIDKIKRSHYGGYKKNSDSKVVLQMIYEWVKQDKLSVNEFCSLLNYARESISRNGKNPYNGNEDPESILP